MALTAIRTGKLDRMAIGLSGLCLVHCLATSVAFALLASAGSVFGAEWIHEVGLVLAMAMGMIALGKGVADHGYALPSAVGGLGLGIMGGALTLPHDGSEAMATIVGVAILALGHRLNDIAAE
ncbi:MerC domain-containing protein [Sphingomonas mesophila]|uniref:MerC domain-containing protein n=1 Tax=Sphingomonas mesophila TaxID=2303576 RepID=UPI000E591251|nr:MerC domain-containing protein [Sphingomonas mesophila]